MAVDPAFSVVGHSERPLADPLADAELIGLIGQWCAAEREYTRIADEAERREDEYEPVPRPAELLRRPGDANFFGLSMVRIDDGSFDAEWIETMAPLADRARSFAHPYSQACAARFDEIRRAHRKWSDAEEASRAAAGLPELQRACDDAWGIAADLRRRVAAAPAQTAVGMLAKLRALADLRGAEAIGDELDRALAQPGFGLDVVLRSVARDCASLAAHGALDTPLAA
jgi:hypothetical protein